MPNSLDVNNESSAADFEAQKPIQFDCLELDELAASM